MSSSQNYNCTVKQGTGYIMCWTYGVNPYGIIDIPENVQYNGHSVQTTDQMTCILTLQFKLSCFGANQIDLGDLDIPPDFSSEVKSYSVSNARVCIVNQHENARCFGHNPFGDSDLPEGLSSGIELIYNGEYAIRNCVLKINGALICLCNGMFSTENKIELFKVIGKGELKIRHVSIGIDIFILRQDNKLMKYDPETEKMIYHEFILDQAGINKDEEVLWMNTKYQQIDKSIIITIENAETSLKDYLCIVNIDRKLICEDNFSHKVFQKNTISFTMSYRFSCAMHLSGYVLCWDNHYFSHLEVPQKTLLENYTQLSIGFKHRCLLRSVNYLTCSGLNKNGQLDIPDNFNERMSGIATGFLNSCARSLGGYLKCWGASKDGLENVPLPHKAVLLFSMGNRHACMVTGGYKMFCWGYNREGQIDGFKDQDEVIEETLKYIGLLKNARGVGVTAGGGDSISKSRYSNGYESRLRSGKGGVGFNVVNVVDGKDLLKKGTKASKVEKEKQENGKNKDKKNKNKGKSTNDLHAEKIIHVSAGGSHTCYIIYLTSHNIQQNLYTYNNKLKCIGDNQFGQTSIPNPSNPLIPYTSIKFASAGQKHSCLISNTNEIICFGRIIDYANNPYDYFDYNTINYILALNDEIPMYITSGQYHSCTQTTKNNVYCWGLDKDGQVTVPPDMVDENTWGMYAGWNESSGITKSGKVLTWGVRVVDIGSK